MGRHSRWKSAPAEAHQGYAVCSKGRLLTHEPLSHSDLHSVVEFEHSKRSDDGYARIGELPGNTGHTSSVGIVAESSDFCSGQRGRERQLLPEWRGHLLQ